MKLEFDEVMELVDVAPDMIGTYFLLFVQYRNIRSGANTITRSGITSPNKGLLEEWPAWGPEGGTTALGNKEGTSELVASASGPSTSTGHWEIIGGPGGFKRVWVP